MRKSRHINYEILRILAMIMIVCLHYLGKGGALTDPKAHFGINSYIAWIVEAFCLVSVNIYVLISGYFGVDSSFDIRKPVRIWLQVFFYSAIIGGIFMAVGLQKFDIYQLFTYIFPLSTDHYWFATSYVILYFLMPFINIGFHKLERKTLRGIIICMLVLFSASKTLIPMQLPIDHDGYDVVWFVCLYMTGAYIRRYASEDLLRNRLTRTWKKLAAYVVSCLLVFTSLIVVKYLYETKGILGEMINYGYSYNFFFTYTASVGLFLTFGKPSRTSDMDSVKNKVITTLSGATFGVYLIHEHINLRYLWPTWFNCSDAINKNPISFFLHMIATVLLMYIACTLIELVRIKIFDVLQNRIGKVNG